MELHLRVKISAFITLISANYQKYDPISPIIFTEDLKRNIFTEVLHKKEQYIKQKIFII